MTLNHIFLIFLMVFASFFNLNLRCSGEPRQASKAQLDIFAHVVSGWANYMRLSSAESEDCGSVSSCKEFKKAVAEPMGLDELVRLDQLRRQEDEGRMPLPTPDILRRSHLSSLSTDISAENPDIEFFAEAYRAEHPEKNKHAVRRPSDASTRSCDESAKR